MIDGPNDPPGTGDSPLSDDEPMPRHTRLIFAGL